MSKHDQSQAKSQANQQISQNNANEQEVTGMSNDIFDTSRATGASILPGITAGYSDIAGTGGGVDETSQAAFNNLATGTPQATDLATTGGLSPTSIQAMKDEASQAAQGSFNTAQDQAARTAAATGGYGDTSAIQALLARQGSDAASKAVVDSEATIGGLEQSGKIAGTGLLQAGMATGASGLAGTQQNITANKLQALGGSTNIYGMSEQESLAAVDQILSSYQSTGQLNNQDLAILTNLANQPGVFDKIVSTVGTLGGAAAGVLGAKKP
jgi:hypothetical protein